MKLHNAGHMITPREYLQSWTARFRHDRLARQVVTGLAARSQEIWTRTFAALNVQSPEYRNSVDAEFTTESRNHCAELLRVILAIASGRIEGTDQFAFVRKHAEWRAQHGVPLVASLHAYRVAHKTYWDFTRQALAGKPTKKGALSALATLSDFWLELFEVVGALLEEGHAEEEARIVAQNSQAYGALVDALLRGEIPVDRTTHELGKLFGIGSGMRLAVVLVRPVHAGHPQPLDSDASLRSTGRLIQQVFPSSLFGKLIAVRSQESIVILSASRETVALAARTLAASPIVRNGDGSSVRATIGISLEKIEIAHLPDALAEARIALHLTDPSRPLICFGNIDLVDFLIRTADSAALRLVPEWARQAHRLNDRSTDLVRTMRVFAECNLRVKHTARRLRVHVNTVYFRLNKIKERTGLDPRTFAGASYLLAALRLLDVRAVESSESSDSNSSSPSRAIAQPPVR